MSSDNQKLKEQELKRNPIIYIVPLSCFLIGMAVGFITGNIAAGIVGGLGTGFFGMGLTLAFEKHDKRVGLSSYMFVGCLLIGFALGLFTGNILVGLFGGLGVGAFAMAIAYQFTGQW